MAAGGECGIGVFFVKRGRTASLHADEVTHPHPSHSTSGGHENNSWKQGLEGVGGGCPMPCVGQWLQRQLGRRAAPGLGTLEGGWHMHAAPLGDSRERFPWLLRPGWRVTTAALGRGCLHRTAVSTDLAEQLVLTPYTRSLAYMGASPTFK